MLPPPVVRLIRCLRVPAPPFLPVYLAVLRFVLEFMIFVFRKGEAVVAAINFIIFLWFVIF